MNEKCRLCFKDTRTLVAVTSVVHELYVNCMRVKLPKISDSKICVRCLFFLEEFQEFKLECIENQLRYCQQELSETTDSLVILRPGQKRQCTDTPQNSTKRFKYQEIRGKMKSLLETYEDGAILQHYETAHSLTEEFRDKVLQYSAMIAVSRFGKQELRFAHLQEIAVALMEVFPEEFPLQDTLVTPQGDGILYDIIDDDVRFSQKIRRTIEDFGEERILVHYETNERLTDIMKKESIKIGAHVAVEHFWQAVTQFENIQKVAQALMNLFPKEFVQEELLVTREQGGLLYYAAQYRLKNPTGETLGQQYFSKKEIAEVSFQS